jgi:hypothetical protein
VKGAKALLKRVDTQRQKMIDLKWLMVGLKTEVDT